MFPYLLYAPIILLGLVAMPTTMFSSTPLSCVPCTSRFKNCKFMYEDYENNVTKPEFSHSRRIYDGVETGDTYSGLWLKKYCTQSEVDIITLYFPYMLLLVPLMMVGLNKGFVT